MQPPSPAVAAVFEPVQTATTFEETVERLGTAIRLGLLAPGERLPPERDLAEQLGIARSTLRQALASLTESGHLVAQRGRGGGTFVADAPPMAESTRIELDAGEWRDLLDHRIGVEVGTIVLAAERAEAEDLGRLEEHIAAMRAAVGFCDYRRADVLFHLGIAEAARSARLLAAITDIQGEMSELLAHIAHPAPVLARSNEQHTALVLALARRDAAGAARLMREHLKGTEQVLAGLMPRETLSERPLIGLCPALERAQYGVWDRDAVLLARSYVDAVQRAGGIAVMLPPDPAVAADPDRVLDLLDGLILAGGRDVDPATYGADRHPDTDQPTTDRDEFEIALARRAMERDLPLLGICRGMQLMNIARGGTLVQHLPEHVGHEEHRRMLGTFTGNDHPVHLSAGSLAARAAGEAHHGTLSHHHQGIDRVGDGLEVSGWADDDELPEALEDPTLRFALGVQWHPEADDGSRVIAALVDAARRPVRRP